MMKVKIEFTWEFDKKDWTGLNEHLSNLETIKQISTKAKFDAIDVFHHLNNICIPDAEVTVL